MILQDSIRGNFPLHLLQKQFRLHYEAQRTYVIVEWIITLIPMNERYFH